MASWSGPMPRCGESVPPSDVVEAVELAGALDRLDVERLLDHADARAVALRVGAERARIDRGDAVARGAVEELLLDLEDRLREAARRLQLGS